MCYCDPGNITAICCSNCLERCREEEKKEALEKLPVKSYFLNGDINAEQAKKLMEFLNDNENARILIYVDSSGGACVTGRVILNELNARKDRIKLVVAGVVAGAAFDIFLKFEGERSVLPYSWGATCRLVPGHKDGGMSAIDLCKTEMIAAEDRDDRELLSTLGLTDKEWGDYRDGKDVYFTDERLQELLNSGSKKRKDASKFVKKNFGDVIREASNE